MLTVQKKASIVIVCILAVIVIAAFGWIGFKHYKIQRYTASGDQAISEGQWPVASFWYSKVLEIDTENATALRKLANFASLYHDQTERFWWKRWYDSDPENPEIQLGYAEVLVRTGSYAEAKSILDETLPPPDQQSKYNNVVTAYFLGIEDFHQAENYTRKSIQIDPESIELKLNLLNILLRIGDPQDADEVNKLLAEISSQPNQLPEVWRVMLSFALTKQDYPTAIGLARKLANRDNSDWREHVAYLKLLIYHEPENAEIEILTLVDPNVRAFENISKSLIHAQRADLLLKWVEIIHSESEIRNTLAFKIGIAEAKMQVEQWDSLDQFLTSQTWEVLDYYREAILSRVYLEKELKYESQKHWLLAINESKEYLQAPQKLAIICQNWPGFENRYISLLEDMLQKTVYTEWAYQRLHEYYYQRQQTAQLHGLSIRARKLLPKNDNIKNNAIMYSLLLNTDIEKQLTDAHTLYEKYPQKPIPTATYAFALYKNGKFDEAWQAIKSMDSRFLNIAEIAYYAALVAAKSGNVDRVNELENKALDATLLPEELALSEGVL